jgi:ribosomal protein S18 acetylase RimI-like enzyme/DNA-binding MarR family transcriptional regulator
VITNKSSRDFLIEQGEFAIPSRLKRIAQKIANDSLEIYKQEQIDFEPGWFNFVSLLHQKGELSVMEIAHQLRISHPAIVQTISKLKAKNYVKTSSSSTDSRVTLVKLTELGNNSFHLFKSAAQKIEGSIKELIDEVDPNFMLHLNQIEEILISKGVLARVLDKNKSEQINNVKVMRYADEYRHEFYRLNAEWLKKYFEIEEEDEKILADPMRYFLKSGGEIFFAFVNGKIAGTCGVNKIDKRTFELSKMAVSEEYQGRQVGKKLALTAIGYAYEKGANRIVLETSPKLKAAINLYEKLGFKIIEETTPSKYKRTVFKMELKLK